MRNLLLPGGWPKSILNIALQHPADEILRRPRVVVESAVSQKTDLDLPMGCAVQGAVRPGFESILTREALDFVAELARKFGPRVKDLLARREARIAATALRPYGPGSARARRTPWPPERSDFCERDDDEEDLDYGTPGFRGASPRKPGAGMRLGAV